MRLRARPERFPRSLFFRAAIGAAAAACAVTPRSALADDSATAQALFDEAMALKGKEQWAEACPKFESSYKLDPALGTLLNLANCYEKLGKTASAWAKWEEAYQWALKHNDERADLAKTSRDALAPNLPRLKIIVKNPVPALSIERDTSKVSDAMYGTALPVDPGEHSVFVRRDDEVLKTEKVKVVAAQTAEVTFDLAAIEKAAPPPKKKGVVVVGVSPTLRKVGWAVGGVGVGGVIAAAALEGVALAKKADADAPGVCVGKYCTPQGKALANDAKLFAEVGQWVGIASLVVTAVGVTLLIVAPSKVGTEEAPATPKDASARRSVWATPWVAPEIGAGGDAPGLALGLVLGGNL